MAKPCQQALSLPRPCSGTHLTTCLTCLTPPAGNVSASSLSPSPTPEATSGGSGDSQSSNGGDTQDQQPGGNEGDSPSPSPRPSAAAAAAAASTDGGNGGGGDGGGGSGSGGGSGGSDNSGGGGGGGGSSLSTPEPEALEQSPPTPEDGGATVVDTGDIPTGSLTSLDAARRRLAGVSALRSSRRALLQAAGSSAAAQPAFDGTLYIVASRGLDLMSPGGTPNLEDVLVSGGAVQRAYDVIDAAGEDGACGGAACLPAAAAAAPSFSRLQSWLNRCSLCWPQLSVLAWAGCSAEAQPLLPLWHLAGSSAVCHAPCVQAPTHGSTITTAWRAAPSGPPSLPSSSCWPTWPAWGS